MHAQKTTANAHKIPHVYGSFGVSYLAVGLVVIFVPVTFHHALHGVIVILALVIWTTLTLLLPVPGCPTGYLGQNPPPPPPPPPPLPPHLHTPPLPPYFLSRVSTFPAHTHRHS